MSRFLALVCLIVFAAALVQAPLIGGGGHAAGLHAEASHGGHAGHAGGGAHQPDGEPGAASACQFLCTVGAAAAPACGSACRLSLRPGSFSPGESDMASGPVPEGPEHPPKSVSA